MTKLLLIIMCGLFTLACSGPETRDTDMHGFYIGTYTNEESQGIYHAWFNPETGELSSPKLAATTPNPSFLALDKQANKIYAVNEMVPDRDTGTVTAFSIENDSLLTAEATLGTRGAYPCYISLDGDNLFVANYGGGNILHAGISGSGGLTTKSVHDHSGNGPHPNQETPHAHFIRRMPGTNVVLAADLGTDKVYQYSLDNDSLTLIDSLALQPGSGPRHIDFHPRLPVMYVINELNSTIAVFSFDQSRNSFNEMQLISTLPDGYEGESYCADIHVHPNGRFLFGSNRGHDSIVSYRIGDEGMLEMTGHFSEGVTWPRNFAIAPGGQFILIGNERGNSIISASIDPSTGVLASSGHQLELSRPVCILFE